MAGDLEELFAFLDRRHNVWVYANESEVIRDDLIPSFAFIPDSMPRTALAVSRIYHL
jgi:hypothetical protein